MQFVSYMPYFRADTQTRNDSGHRSQATNNLKLKLGSLFIFIFEGCILLRLLLQSFWVPSIATVIFEFLLLLLLHTHYMSNIYAYIYIGYFTRSYFFYNEFVVLVLVIKYIYIYISFFIWRFFSPLSVCGGYDCLLLLLHFSVLSYYNKINYN
jgi:hypothetical protein